MTQPVRLRLSRAPGFSLQAWSRATNGLPAINIARPGRWGNPFIAGFPVDKRQAQRWGWRLAHPDFVCATTEIAVRRFTACVALDEAYHPTIRRLLGGRNLACWCAPNALCHGDALLEIANRPEAKAA